MRRTFAHLRSHLRRLRDGNEAVAAVEFALIMPLLLFLYFGSMEAADLFTADRRINTVSAAMGDLVSQWDPGDGKLPTTVMNDYLVASSRIMSPYSTTGLGIVVTLVQVRNDGTTRVLWSTANGSGTARTVGASYGGLPATSRMNILARGGCVMAAEAVYPFRPMLGQVFESTLRLAHTNYFLPRFGSSDVINLQTTNLARTACTAA